MPLHSLFKTVCLRSWGWDFTYMFGGTQLSHHGTFIPLQILPKVTLYSLLF